MAFAGWISEKYDQWRKDRYGREGSIEAYAQYVGVPGNVMREWIKRGKEPKHKKYVDPLVNRYGYEVYEILGIDPPDELPGPEDATFADWIRLLKQLPEKDREELLASARARLREQMQESEQAPDQVEDAKVNRTDGQKPQGRG